MRSGAVTLGPGNSEPTLESDLRVPGDQGSLDERANMTVDFGFYQPVSVGNYVWYDLNANGTQNGGEPPVVGATVRLFNENGIEIPVGPDGILGTGDDANGGMLTNATGNYQFSNLPPGDYFVRLTPPTGYESTPVSGGDPDTNPSDTDNNGTQVGAFVESPVFSLTVGGEVGDGDANANNNPSVDFGLSGYSLGNRVWADVNNNGLIDPTESGIGGTTVRLYASNGVTEINLSLIHISEPTRPY